MRSGPRFHPAAYEANFDLADRAADDSRTSSQGLGGRALRALLPEHGSAGDHDPDLPVLCSARSRPTPSPADRFPRLGMSSFALVLLQLLVMPDILIVENYQLTMRFCSAWSTRSRRLRLPYIASGFGIFLLRQTFMTVPREFDEAARVEGASVSSPFSGGSTRAPGAADVSRLRPGLGQPPLEQLPLAADHHQFGRDAACHGRPQRLRGDRQRHRMVGDQRRDADDLGPAPDRLPACSSANSCRASCAPGSSNGALGCWGHSRGPTRENGPPRPSLDFPYPVGSLRLEALGEGAPRGSVRCSM